MDCFPVINNDGQENTENNKHKRSLEHSTNQGHWYGGGESSKGAWPLEMENLSPSAFVTGDDVR